MKLPYVPDIILQPQNPLTAEIWDLIFSRKASANRARLPNTGQENRVEVTTCGPFPPDFHPRILRSVTSNPAGIELKLVGQSIPQTFEERGRTTHDTCTVLHDEM